MIDLEKKIKFLLKKNDKTQQELCDYIDMTTQNLGKIWKNNDMKMSDLIKISNFFSIKKRSTFLKSGTFKQKKSNSLN